MNLKGNYSLPESKKKLDRFFDDKIHETATRVNIRVEHPPEAIQAEHGTFLNNEQSGTILIAPAAT